MNMLTQQKLMTYLRDYLIDATSQEPEEAKHDSQLKCILLPILQACEQNKEGVLLDVGCGKGVLLQKLVDSEFFTSNSGWTYWAIDTDDNLSILLQLAARARIHRRVQEANLEDFYSDKLAVPETFKVAVVRNVLHELTIRETARLIHKLNAILNPGEVLILQDLLVFPCAERGNACWTTPNLTKVLRKSGFTTIQSEEPSKSGNRWFSYICKRDNTQSPELREIEAQIAAERRRQWLFWRDLGLLHEGDLEDRDLALAKIDFDLQFAALAIQLSEYSGSSDTSTRLSVQQEEIVARETFQKALYCFNPHSLPSVMTESIAYFKDRGNNQDALEKFVVSDERWVLIQGGRLMGKSVLVDHVLSRYPHQRTLVKVDLSATGNVWNILEQVFASMGINLAVELLSRVKNLAYEFVRETVEEFLRAVGNRCIYIFDHFERILDPIGRIEDDEVRKLLVYLVDVPLAKVIFTGTRNFTAGVLPEDTRCKTDQPPVYRLPDEPHHVVNILKDVTGILEYPKDLLDAIDRHPFMAYLAGLYIRKEGCGQLNDGSFITKVRHGLKESIVTRIADEETRPVVELLSLVRIPVPKDLPQPIITSSAIMHAHEQGLLVRRRDFAYDFVYRPLSALTPDRESQVSDLFDIETCDTRPERDDSVSSLHNRLAECFLREHKKFGDPRFLREYFYHKISAGAMRELDEIGQFFRDTIVQAGEYWFVRKKDFESALWAFKTAKRLGVVGYHVEMRIAACLVRTDGMNQGIALFLQLIDQYPDQRGIKSSLIDSLLSRKEWEMALERLDEFEFTFEDDAWTAVQYGRAYMGLHRNDDAYRAFSLQIRLDPEPIAFQSLARVCHRMGRRDEEEDVLDRGISMFPENRSLRLAKANLLIQDNDNESARAIVDQLHNAAPSNGWVILSRLRIYCNLDLIDDAWDIWNKARDTCYPDRLRTRIEAELNIASRRYALADEQLANESDDEYVVGMRKELYFSWSLSALDREERVQIAEKGLALKVPEAYHNNAPILVSCAKLALMARQRNELESILRRIYALNPQLREVRFVVEQAKEIWPELDTQFEV